MQTEIKVTRVPLDRNGYDRHGRYFGLGPKLYRVEWFNHDTPWPHVRYERASDYQSLRQALKPHGKVLP